HPYERAAQRRRGLKPLTAPARVGTIRPGLCSRAPGTDGPVAGPRRRPATTTLLIGPITGRRRCALVVLYACAGSAAGAGEDHSAEMALARPFLWVETVPRVDRPSFRWQIWRRVCSPCTRGPVLPLAQPRCQAGQARQAWSMRWRTRGFTGNPRCPAVVAAVLCRRCTGVHFEKVGNRRAFADSPRKGTDPDDQKEACRGVHGRAVGGRDGGDTGDGHSPGGRTGGRWSGVAGR